MTEPEPSEKKLSLLQVIGSVLAGAFGVQSAANRERDFTQGKFSTFIIGGIVFLVLFIVVVYSVVQIVLSSAGVNQ